MSSRLYYQSWLPSILPNSSINRASEIQSCFTRHENLRLLLILHRYILSAQCLSRLDDLTPLLFPSCSNYQEIGLIGSDHAGLFTGSGHSRVFISLPLPAHPKSSFQFGIPHLEIDIDQCLKIYRIEWPEIYLYRYADGPSVFRGAYWRGQRIGHPAVLSQRGSQSNAPLPIVRSHGGRFRTALFKLKNDFEKITSIQFSNY